jgi:hypothetical protein
MQGSSREARRSVPSVPARAPGCGTNQLLPEKVGSRFLSLLQTVTSQTFSAAIWAARKASFQAALSVRLDVSAPE